MAPPVIRTVPGPPGLPLLEGRLESASARVRVLSWGAALTRWQARLAGGGWRDVAVGLPAPADYPADAAALGAVVGRVANRVAGARFVVGGREHRVRRNDGPNVLHGGPLGLSRRAWAMSAEGEALRLDLVLPDGEGGWPGRVAVTLRLGLEGPRLTWAMEARPDRPTPLALAQHVYWNLDDAGRAAPVAGHRLRVAASRFTPVGPDMIPTGAILPVEGTALDFRAPRRLSGADGAPLALDVNLALDPGAGPAATLTSAAGDLRLTLRTDQPGLQVYTAPGLALPGRGPRPFGAVCLEAQGFANAVNTPAFPPVIATPEAPHRQRTSVEITPADAG